jgi:hypothetical protein
VHLTTRVHNKTNLQSSAQGVTYPELVPAVGELAEISVEASSLLLEIPAKKKKAYSVIIQIFLSAGETKKSYQPNVPIWSKYQTNTFH